MRPSSPLDNEEYEDTYESDSDNNSEDSIPPMPPPFSPLDSSRQVNEDATGDFLDDVFPRPPPNKSGQSSQTVKSDDMGFDEKGASSLMGVLNKEGYLGFSIDPNLSPKKELLIDHGMSNFEHDDGLVGTTPTTTSHMHKGISVGGATPISTTDALMSPHLLATPPSGQKSHFKLSTPQDDINDDVGDDEGEEEDDSDCGEGSGLFLNTGGSSHRQRMGTAHGEKSPFDSGDEDDEESEQSTEEEAESDEELTEEQQKMAEELGMFSGTPLRSSRQYEDNSDVFVDDDDGENDEKMDQIIANHNDLKKKKQFFDQQKEDDDGDGERRFALRSWSGRRKFDHDFDDNGGIPEFIPPIETSETGDRWTSPVKKQVMVEDNGSQEKVKRNDDVDDDDEDVEEDVEEEEENDEGFMDRGGVVRTGVDALGWEKNTKIPSTSPISSPRKASGPRKGPGPQSAQKKALSEKEELEQDKNYIQSSLFQNNNSIFGQFINNKNALKSNRNTDDEDDDDDEQQFDDDDDEEEEEEDEEEEDYGNNLNDNRKKSEDLDATEKQKRMLAELAEEKRRLKELEEEKILKLAERKKRKTEALLERARLRRAMANEAPKKEASSKEDGDMKRQQNKKGGKRGKHNTLVESEEDQTASSIEEAERVAMIAAKRKQFKMNHKKHLNQLSEKRKQEEMAKMEAEAEEEARVRAIKEKGLLRVRMHLEAERLKAAQTQAPDSPSGSSHHSTGSGGNAKKKTSDNSPPGARGSGMAAVRAARNSSDMPVEVPPELSALEKKERVRDMRIAKGKQVELLKAMAEEAKKQKEKDEIARLRMERRAVLKKERILAEALARRKQIEEEGGQKVGDGNVNMKENENKENLRAKVLKQKLEAKNAKAKIDMKKKNKKNKQESDDDDDDEDDDTKPSFEDQKNAISRLAGHKKVDDQAGGKGGSNARDFDDWKRKNGVPSDGKVFSLTGWYPCIKEALLARGWFFNPDRESFFFDLKWTLKSNELKQDQLQPWQLTNHFLKNTAITTKVGLLKSIRQLSWFTSVHPDAIFPRSYDLNNADDMQTFLDDYRCTTAQGMLKEIVDKCRVMDSESALKIASRCGKQFGSAFDAKEYNSDVLVNSCVLDVCLSVCSRQSDPMINTDEYLDSPKMILKQPVTPIEWEVLGYASKQIYNTSSSNNHKHTKVKDERPIFKKWNPAELLIPDKVPIALDAFLIPNVKNEPKNTRDLQRIEREERKKKVQLELERKSISSKLSNELEPIGEERLRKIVDILAKLDDLSAQCALNGRFCTKNLWIVKPSAKSRGRGIMTFRDIDKLLEYIGVGESGQSTAMWVVQKYMENPLIIAKRKFDIRQWVLVTDWNPLTIYFYNECYARFSASEYSDDDKDLENVHVHLVNNSVGKDCEDFHKKVIAEDGEEIVDCMWSMKQISSFMKFKAKDLGIFKGHDSGKITNNQEGEDVFQTRCEGRMREIAKCSLMSAQGQVEHRKNSWELYGFDFMFDDDFRPWLIEINSSPACDYSTPTTEDFVPRALTDVLKVVVDLRENEMNNKKMIETGGWEKIFKGPPTETTKTALGVDLACQVLFVYLNYYY